LVFLMVIAESATAQDKSKIEVVPQVGHSQWVLSIAFSPDGRTVLSGSGDSTLKLWDVATGTLMRTFVGHSEMVQSVAFAPDGRTVLSGGHDRTLKLWDVATGRPVRTFAGHSGSVTSVAFAPDGRTVLSGSWDRTLKLWDVATGTLMRTFEGHSEWVEAVVFSPDGRTALSGSWDNTLRLWDVATGRLVRTFVGHSDVVDSVAFSPDGRMVLSGSQDNTLRLWDVATGRPVHTFEGHSNHVKSVAFSRGGRTVLSGSHDNTLKLWDVATRTLMRTFEGHSDGVESVAFAPDGRTVLSGSRDMTLRLWDVATGRLMRIFEGHTEEVTSVAFSPDGRTMLSGGYGRTLKLWDVAAGALVRTFEGHLDPVMSVAFSPDGRTVLSGNWDKTLKLWDVAAGALVRTFEGHSDPVMSVAFSPDGRTVLSGSDDKTLKLWDVGTGKPLRTLVGHSGRVRSVAFSPDGRTVLSGSEDKTLKLWDVATGRLVRTFEGHSGLVASVAFSRDGRTVLSGSWDKTLKLWDVATGRLVHTFEGHSSLVTSVAYSPDARTVLSGSWDNTLRLWDVTTGALVHTFVGHSGLVMSVAFSPDGRTVLSGSRDGTVRLWNASTGQLLASLIGRLDGQWLAITPAGLFDASDGALDMVSVVRRLDVFSSGQFRDQLQRKDLLRELLSGDPLFTYAKSAEHLNLELVLASGDPPQVQLTGRELVGDSVRLTVRLFNNTTGGIGTRLEWRVNGALQGDPEPVALQSTEARKGPVTVAQGLKLVSNKDNFITVTAYNDKNLLSSRPLPITVSRGDVIVGEERRSRLYILGFGVNKYTGPRLKTLNLAVDDVSSLAKALSATAEAGGYEIPAPSILPESDATKTGIELAFKKLADKNIGQRDALIVILAGHGLSDGKCYYFVPSGALIGDSQENTKKESVSCDELRNMMSSVQAGKKALFIDTCDSAAASGIILRGDEHTLRESTMERLHNATGYSVFSAARDAAHEDIQLGHGLLTYAVLEALARPGPQGDVDALSIKAFVDQEVPKLSERWYQEAQTPLAIVSGEFPLGPPRPFVPTPRRVPLAGDYVLNATDRIKLYNEIGPNKKVLQEFDPYSKVQVFEFRPDGWALIGRPGSPPLGWVPSETLHRTN